MVLTQRKLTNLLGVMVAATAVLCGPPKHALALPIVAANSSYNLTIANFQPLNPNLNAATLTFDGLAETFPLIAGGTIQITETETPLSNVSSRLDFILTSDTDMYPASLGGTIAGINIGIAGNPLDLTRDINLVSATADYFNAAGALIGTFNLLPFVSNPAPWDGFFIGPGQFIGVNNAVGAGIQEIQLTLVLDNMIPEPITATLGLFGLTTLALTTRRRTA